ncbi:MAG: aldehyde ferredoxin oxidoreductase family protein [Candidatus Cloacimonetes bacterium]|nr:aldehyde ferredoxin oxidoreductase family protein [Candidatus Cloacimonadota bacterium]MCF7812932.1 aldehyde ferredoxin oxidoreductase family protein [Candidatus Cloacimonadota bacterium]MCF7867144.1 aldehyde ferredoxin oxidoreductase family protein [Candidatus Cloacimonadota bacterium]MCF7882536.1 aldehyde ferredoxin oxidoreductase family protein [Candidatus Cloacimonadota bacterium]
MKSKNVFGWMNKISKIDLTDNTQEEIKINEENLRKYLGGRGLGVKLYSDLCSPDTDPLSSDNAFIFLTGPLTGLFPTAGRYQIISRSPQTGTIFDTSSGGVFGERLKKTGLDGIIITGKAKEPVYLLITNDKIEIKKADHLWGKNTQQTRDILQEEYSKKASVASIGPAGENQVIFASIMNDKDRAAGRGGMGAVMGSKNLKAIVALGTKEIPVADPEGLKEILTKIDRLIDKNPVTGKSLPLLGTSVLVNIINAHGMFPTENFQRGVFNDAEGISGEKITETLLQKRSACFKCPMACGRTTKTVNKEGEGPEYETVWAFGAQLGINDLTKITEANYLCNELGLDTITTGNTIGCAMELYEKGAFPHELKWGDADVLEKLVEDIACKRGIGEDLALGSKRLAEKYGRPELAMQVKGLELPAYDPRGAQGQALAYATSNRGGCHMRAYMISNEILGSPMILDRYSSKGKAEIVALLQDVSAVVDSLVLCRFIQFAVSISTLTEMVNIVTGLDYTEEELLEAGKRIYTLERDFNAKAGFDRKDDLLPSRFMEEELQEGSSRHRVVQLNKMLNDYYQVRGWDENGIPTKKVKEKLGI